LHAATNDNEVIGGDVLDFLFFRVYDLDIKALSLEDLGNFFRDATTVAPYLVPKTIRVFMMFHTSKKSNLSQRSLLALDQLHQDAPFVFHRLF
jgi:hypothetical protein